MLLPNSCLFLGQMAQPHPLQHQPPQLLPFLPWGVLLPAIHKTHSLLLCIENGEAGQGLLYVPATLKLWSSKYNKAIKIGA